MKVVLSFLMFLMFSGFVKADPPIIEQRGQVLFEAVRSYVIQVRVEKAESIVRNKIEKPESCLGQSPVTVEELEAMSPEDVIATNEAQEIICKELQPQKLILDSAYIK